MMSGDQLATLCLEELNNPQPSLLVARVIKNNDLWQKLNESLNSGVFNGRVDGVGEKIVKLQECHQLLQVAVLAEGEKKSTEEERRLQQIEEELLLREYVTVYLQFYDKYSGVSNPFNKTVQDLTELYSEFMEYFFQLNPQPIYGLIKDKAITSSDNLFKEHYYTQSVDASFIHKPKDATTCYDDDWARPFYE